MANSFELSGILKVLEETQTFASGFSKREFVIEVPDGKYAVQGNINTDLFE